ncbi:MAG: helicase-associated domain-containing protein, partial [Anaerolineaceae bacterium]|nr:helicase-associated domain-containing protein [Anaerolineaceae bacterium]
HDENGAYNSEAIRNFLTRNRTAARLQLLGLWRNSDDYDELAETGEIKIIQAPDYKKKQARNTILGILKTLPVEIWISCSGFINAVKGTFPNFLRETFSENRGQMLDPDGNDLSGIGSWYQLEGAYLRFLLFGPLKWLGIIQTAFPDRKKTAPTAFRISKAALFYLTESEEPEIPEEILKKPGLEQGLPIIASDGAVTCSSRVPRYFRYMTARYTEIEKINGTTVIFRITPSSLSEAETRGLTGKAFFALLLRFTKNKVPPALGKMLDSGNSPALPATVYSATVLTVPEEKILSELLETARLEKWIIQQINSTSLIIDRKGIPEIRRFLMEKGLFVDVQLKAE